MLRDYEKYPPKENLRNKLFSFFNNEQQDIYIIYRYIQRIKTNLETYCYHFLTKIQSGYLKKLKENIEDEEVIILSSIMQNQVLDFTEIIQTYKIKDEIQANPWKSGNVTSHFNLF